MKILNTRIKGLKIIKGKNYYDSRGFSKKSLSKKLKIHKPIFWCMSKSKKMF